jgi:hypothetical protein
MRARCEVTDGLGELQWGRFQKKRKMGRRGLNYANVAVLFT